MKTIDFRLGVLTILYAIAWSLIWKPIGVVVLVLFSIGTLTVENRKEQ